VLLYSKYAIYFYVVYALTRRCPGKLWLIWTHLIDCSGRRRLQREKRDSRDPTGSIATEEARPRPRKASAWNVNQTESVTRAYSLKYQEHWGHVSKFIYFIIFEQRDDLVTVYCVIRSTLFFKLLIHIDGILK